MSGSWRTNEIRSTLTLPDLENVCYNDLTLAFCMYNMLSLQGHFMKAVGCDLLFITLGF